MWKIEDKQYKIDEQTKPNKNKHIDTENRIVVIRRGMFGGRQSRKVQTTSYKINKY